MILRALGAVCLLAATAQADDIQPSIDPGVIDTCLFSNPSQLLQQACIGIAANLCQDRAGDYSTVTISACLDAELQYWDGRLNTEYAKLMDAAKRADAEASASGDNAPPLAPALRDMQRAWIAYRDASCTYEASLWGNGTGATPAFVGCMLNETGRQALILHQHLPEH